MQVPRTRTIAHVHAATLIACGRLWTTVDRPETKYVPVGDANVAYQVLGDGPLDLLFCHGLGSHIEVGWQDPSDAEFLSRLASFSRLIFFDRRGTGASDGVPRNAIPTWEEWTEDMTAVLHATGSNRTAILATLDTGPIGILYAAMHPEQVKRPRSPEHRCSIWRRMITRSEPPPMR
jgi:pimeloyl-ACP methyl ester carboxylesterase